MCTKQTVDNTLTSPQKSYLIFIDLSRCLASFNHTLLDYGTVDYRKVLALASSKIVSYIYIYISYIYVAYIYIYIYTPESKITKNLCVP